MRLWPRTIVGRTVLVLLLGLVVSQLVGLGFYAGDRANTLAEARARQLGERIAAIAQTVNTTPPVARPALVRSMRWPGLRIRWTPDSPLVEADSRDRWARAVGTVLLYQLGDLEASRLRMAYASPEDIVSKLGEAGAHPGRPGMGAAMGRGMGPGLGRGRGGPGFLGGPTTQGSDLAAGPDRRPVRTLTISLRLDDGSWLDFAMPSLSLRSFWTTRYFLAILLTTLVVIAVSVWAVRRATIPLALFTGAAERLGRDVNAPSLRETGPREVERAARAFNEMQRRLRSFVEDRTRMLAAISHDLRTPITRLKLRAEFVEDEEQRDKMLADLDDMERMIAATLSFARDDASAEARVTLDLADLLQSLCDAASDAGQDARYDGAAHFAYVGAPVALKRAFGNLIDNAVQYGDRALVRLRTDDTDVTVDIEDEGPGIPEAEIERVFEAFHRLDPSRSRETGGVGLGLSVVRSIVRGHGGEIMLANRAEGGLRATVTLPRTPEAKSP